ncbi:glycosyltransferase [Moritella viscosa]|uniref:glycosyltransferase n=1 Tax=Moritella viscosa TaxID=80854 RepID=UPI0015C1C1FC|nr:glycosyltransferase [Moritella viscosa]
MNVCFLITSLARKGPILVVQDIANLLVEYNHEVSVFYFDDIVEVDFNPAVKIKKVKFPSFINFISYDVVHSHLLRGDTMGFLNRKTINRLISTCHSDYRYDLTLSHGRFLGAFVSYFWTYFYQKFDNVVFLTNVNKERYSINNSSIIANGRPINNSEKKIDLGLEANLKGKFVIGACAYVTKRKGFHQVIDYLDKSPKSDEIFVLVGEGPELNNLKKLANEKNVSERCFFIDFKEDVSSYLKRFDLFILTSSSEGMPLSLIEAASLKCPIVATNIPVIKEMFSSDEVSFYDYGSIESLKEAVREIRVNSNYSENVYRKYLSSYTVEKMVDKYILTYKE